MVSSVLLSLTMLDAYRMDKFRQINAATDTGAITQAISNHLNVAVAGS